LTRCAIAKLTVVLGLVAVTIAPAVAAAQEPGGYTYGQDQPAATAPTDVSNSLLARPNAFVGRPVSFRGAISGAQQGQTVQVQRLGADGAWTNTAATAVAADGTFRARWLADHLGRFTLRAVLAGADTGPTAQAATTGTSQITIYRRAVATFFGPGFYGRKTACGQRMSKTLEGVAHPTLPCGTLVDVYYKGRTARVPVVDRGPFRPGTSWDLTAATAAALGFTHTDTIGALRVREAAPPAAPAPAPEPAPADPSGGTQAPS
jgi:rare lipoprotein A (peptidoglycan hydrolase)